jgi:hypothetical protein
MIVLFRQQGMPLTRSPTFDTNPDISFSIDCKFTKTVGLPQMSEVELVLNGRVFRVSCLTLRQVCTHFSTNPLLTQYSVKSTVSTEILEIFLSLLEGEVIEVTKTNFKELSTLCNEFGFELNTPSYRLSQVELAIENQNTDIKRLWTEVAELRKMSEIVENVSKEVKQQQTDLSSLKSWGSLSLNSRIIWGFP